MDGSEWSHSYEIYSVGASKLFLPIDTDDFETYGMPAKSKTSAKQSAATSIPLKERELTSKSSVSRSWNSLEIVEKIEPGKKLFWNPRGDGPNDGTTFSLLSKFLECPRRFGLKVIAGVEEDEGFKEGLEYGNVWHLAEEYAGKPADWRGPVRQYYQKLVKQYPNDLKLINKVMYGFAAQFPPYLEYYKKKQEIEQKRIPIMEEESFRLPFKVFDDQIVMRGKLDLVFGIPSKKNTLIYIQENKTKGDIDPVAIPATLFANLQTMIYANAVVELIKTQPHRFPPNPKFAGVIFNVIRRPASGRPPCGPKRGKGESDSDFWRRTSLDIQKRPHFYFYRWRTDLLPSDISWFNRQTLHPILYRLLLWFDSRANPDKFSPKELRIARAFDFQYPWGMWSPLAQGFKGSYFTYLTSESTKGLKKTTTLFPEL